MPAPICCAFGFMNFIERVKSELGHKARQRKVIEAADAYALREQSEPYRANFTRENDALSSENTRF